MSFNQLPGIFKHKSVSLERIVTPNTKNHIRFFNNRRGLSFQSNSVENRLFTRHPDPRSSTFVLPQQHFPATLKYNLENSRLARNIQPQQQKFVVPTPHPVCFDNINFNSSRRDISRSDLRTVQEHSQRTYTLKNQGSSSTDSHNRFNQYLGDKSRSTNQPQKSYATEEISRGNSASNDKSIQSNNNLNNIINNQCYITQRDYESNQTNNPIDLDNTNNNQDYLVVLQKINEENSHILVDCDQQIKSAGQHLTSETRNDRSGSQIINEKSEEHALAPKFESLSQIKIPLLNLNYLEKVDSRSRSSENDNQNLYNIVYPIKKENQIQSKVASKVQLGNETINFLTCNTEEAKQESSQKINKKLNMSSQPLISPDSSDILQSFQKLSLLFQNQQAKRSLANEKLSDFKSNQILSSASNSYRAEFMEIKNSSQQGNQNDVSEQHLGSIMTNKQPLEKQVSLSNENRVECTNQFQSTYIAKIDDKFTFNQSDYELFNRITKEQEMKSSDRAICDISSIDKGSYRNNFHSNMVLKTSEQKVESQQNENASYLKEEQQKVMQKSIGLSPIKFENSNVKLEICHPQSSAVKRDRQSQYVPPQTAEFKTHDQITNSFIPVSHEKNPSKINKAVCQQIDLSPITCQPQYNSFLFSTGVSPHEHHNFLQINEISYKQEEDVFQDPNLNLGPADTVYRSNNKNFPEQSPEHKFKTICKQIIPESTTNARNQDENQNQKSKSKFQVMYLKNLKYIEQKQTNLEKKNAPIKRKMQLINNFKPKEYKEKPIQKPSLPKSVSPVQNLRDNANLNLFQQSLRSPQLSPNQRYSCAKTFHHSSNKKLLTIHSEQSPEPKIQIKPNESKQHEENFYCGQIEKSSNVLPKGNKLTNKNKNMQNQTTSLCELKVRETKAPLSDISNENFTIKHSQPQIFQNFNSVQDQNFPNPEGKQSQQLKENIEKLQCILRKQQTSVRTSFKDKKNQNINSFEHFLTCYNEQFLTDLVHEKI